MIREGQKVVYAGDADPFQAVGSHGKVLALSGDAAHVQWADGPKVGSVDLVDQHELVPDRQTTPAPVRTNAFAATLDMPEDTALRVRATFDDMGEDGLVTELDEKGYLAMLAGYVEEALGTMSARIRRDPVMEPVLASLDPDEADGLVGRVASVLLTDRLKES